MIKCAIPFISGFSNPGGGFRNCCQTEPQIKSQPGTPFREWWHSKEMQKFRAIMMEKQLPPDCDRCVIAEKTQGKSFRTAINQTVDLEDLSVSWPQRWNVIFGNTCNLGCWSCSENSSSTIEAHKRKLQILPENFKSPEQEFDSIWKQLEYDILESYNYHKTITITILGGEPLYNPKVMAFLTKLIDSGLSNRTKLEFHTNATQCNDKIQSLLAKSKWQYICIFLSLDAVEKKAEWLRYGCRWDHVLSNLPKFKNIANYLEVHCTLSVLNIMDLISLKLFCQENQISFIVTLLAQPFYMSINCWDLDPAFLVSAEHLKKHGYEEFYKLIGSTPVPGSSQALAEYIKKFDAVRAPLLVKDPISKLLDLYH